VRLRPLDVLVAAATPGELARVRSDLERPRETAAGNRPLTMGRIGSLRVAALTTGVGKVNTALALGAALATWRAALLLSVGVGGAFPGSGLAVGDLAVAREEWYGDEGVEDATGFQGMEAVGIPLLEGPEGPRFNDLPADPDVAAALLEAAQGVAGASLGPFVTVSTVTGTRARAETLRNRFGAVCETMEGAAAAHAAASRGIRFGEVRGISNLVGPRDRESWRLFEAAAAAGEAVVSFLRGMESMPGADGGTMRRRAG